MSKSGVIEIFPREKFSILNSQFSIENTLKFRNQKLKIEN